MRDVAELLEAPCPVLPFLDFSVLPRKTLKLTKDFCTLSNPLKPWKNQKKSTNDQGTSLLKLTQEFTGKEGQGTPPAKDITLGVL